MIFLYAIFCQYFSRGCLLRCCFEQKEWQTLLIAFLVGCVIGSPVQGAMSDYATRKRVLLVTIPCVIVSMLIMVFGSQLCPEEYFQILLAVAAIINGVLGNVLPVAAAAYSEQIDDFQKSLRYSFACRYLALGLPFLLKLPHLYSFSTALVINLVSLVIIALKVKDNTHAERV